MASKTIHLNRFDGGVVNNGRMPSARHAKAIANFNVLSDPYRLVPYLSSEDGDSSASTQKIANFVVGSNAGSATVYGLGVDGSGNIKIYNRAIGSDLADATWGSTSNNTASGATSFNDLFVYYANTGMIYGIRGNANIFEYDTDGGTAFNNNDLTLSETASSITNGLVHSKDDILYIGYNNIVAKNNAGTWTDPALTLPAGLKIVSLADYGNFLAIACTPTTGSGKSQVYLWDRDSSLTTLSESISWGDEDLKIVEEVEGELIGISVTNSSQDLFEKVIFRRYIAGVGAVKFLELESGFSPSPGVQLPLNKQKFRGRLYFMMTIVLHGATRQGVWSIGRNPDTREWTLVHERTSDNDTALNTSHTLNSFINIGDILFQSHIDNSTYKMTKTDDQETYSATSYFETVINPGMPLEHATKKKELVSVSLHYEPLPSGGDASVRFRADDTTAWALISKATSDTTAGSVYQEANNYSDGTIFPQGREFEFRIESTGGAVITGLTYEYRILNSQTG